MTTSTCSTSQTTPTKPSVQGNILKDSSSETTTTTPLSLQLPIDVSREDAESETRFELVSERNNTGDEEEDTEGVDQREGCARSDYLHAQDSEPLTTPMDTCHSREQGTEEDDEDAERVDWEKCARTDYLYCSPSKMEMFAKQRKERKRKEKSTGKDKYVDLGKEQEGVGVLYVGYSVQDSASDTTGKDNEEEGPTKGAWQKRQPSVVCKVEPDVAMLQLSIKSGIEKNKNQSTELRGEHDKTSLNKTAEEEINNEPEEIIQGHENESVERHENESEQTVERHENESEETVNGHENESSRVMEKLATESAKTAQEHEDESEERSKEQKDENIPSEAETEEGPCVVDLSIDEDNCGNPTVPSDDGGTDSQDDNTTLEGLANSSDIVTEDPIETTITDSLPSSKELFDDSMKYDDSACTEELLQTHTDTNTKRPGTRSNWPESRTKPTLSHSCERSRLLAARPISDSQYNKLWEDDTQMESGAGDSYKEVESVTKGNKVQMDRVKKTALHISTWTESGAGDSYKEVESVTKGNELQTDQVKKTALQISTRTEYGASDKREEESVTKGKELQTDRVKKLQVETDKMFKQTKEVGSSSLDQKPQGESSFDRHIQEPASSQPVQLNKVICPPVCQRNRFPRRKLTIAKPVDDEQWLKLWSDKSWGPPMKKYETMYLIKPRCIVCHRTAAPPTQRNLQRKPPRIFCYRLEDNIFYMKSLKPSAAFDEINFGMYHSPPKSRKLPFEKEECPAPPITLDSCSSEEQEEINKVEFEKGVDDVDMALLKAATDATLSRDLLTSRPRPSPLSDKVAPDVYLHTEDRRTPPTEGLDTEPAAVVSSRIMDTNVSSLCKTAKELDNQQREESPSKFIRKSLHSNSSCDSMLPTNVYKPNKHKRAESPIRPAPCVQPRSDQIAASPRLNKRKRAESPDHPAPCVQPHSDQTAVSPKLNKRKRAESPIRPAPCVQPHSDQTVVSPRLNKRKRAESPIRPAPCVQLHSDQTAASPRLNKRKRAESPDHPAPCVQSRSDQTAVSPRLNKRKRAEPRSPIRPAPCVQPRSDQTAVTPRLNRRKREESLNQLSPRADPGVPVTEFHTRKQKVSAHGHLEFKKRFKEYMRRNRAERLKAMADSKDTNKHRREDSPPPMVTKGLKEHVTDPEEKITPHVPRHIITEDYTIPANIASIVEKYWLRIAAQRK